MRFLLAIALIAGAARGGGPSFGREVRPILSDKCFNCHGPDEGTRKGKLRLDIEAEARRVLDGAPSEFLARITTHDADERMPPAEANKPLSTAEIDVLTRWAETGARYEGHWAFTAPLRPAPPAVRDTAWPRNDIDRFVLARLDAEDIVPSPEADAITLLRRTHLDLTGLPPTPREIEDYLADNAPGAYERAVDRLLASPHFGERWGRHWLDAARYADSNGYSIDAPRSIWPYRDWVIQAINADMPFDQFVTEQLAGDLLPNATDAQKVATGFLRNTMINEEGGIDKEEFRLEAVMDRVNTVGTVLLGLTMGCARCHTHKYDPIEQREYFSLVAFLNNDDEPAMPVITPEFEAQRAMFEAKHKALQSTLDAYLDGADEKRKAWEAEIRLPFLQGLDEDTREALLVPWDLRDEAQQAAARTAFRKNDPVAREHDEAIAAHEKERPKPPTTMVVAARKEPRETRLLEAGDYTRPGAPVSPGTIAALHPAPPGASTRLDLARWLMARENPLTARVTVNRLWMRLFGRGIVETDDDFGMQGTAPSHPELLDWLAVEFMEGGWRTKALLRTMLTSATYRQASHARPDLDEQDPRNLLLARQSRIRLDAEIIRDAALTAAGVLDTRIGGPSVFPPQPDGVMKLGQSDREWTASIGPDRYRRGLYTYFWRATPHPALAVFDAPDAQAACTRRNRSNTPLQALTLLNDAAYVELASALGERLAAAHAGAPQAGIIEAFFACVGRHPSRQEAEIMASLFASELAAADEPAAWTTVARALFNLDEFITRE